MEKPENSRNSVIAALSQYCGLPNCCIRRANTAAGGGRIAAGVAPDAASACHSASSSAIGRMPMAISAVRRARRHVEPTAISCVGSAQATTRKRSFSNAASITKPSMPMMMMVA